jgi:hypothetical protein
MRAASERDSTAASASAAAEIAFSARFVAFGPGPNDV